MRKSKAGEDSEQVQIEVSSEAGEFSHQPEGAEAPCVTPRAEAICRCGAHKLAWAPVQQAP